MPIPSGLQNPLFSLLAIITLLFSGCSASQVGPGSGALFPRSQSIQDIRTTLSVWVYEQEDTFLSQLVEAFEQEHPEINIVISEIPEESYAERIAAALQEGTGPDIARVWQSEWLAAGYFLPLDSSVEIYRVPFDEFNLGAMTRNCLYAGRVYCLGSLTGGTILVYRKDLFDLFGVPYPPADEPLSIQEYHDMVTRLTQKSDKIEERIWGGDALPPLGWMEPGTHFSTDGRMITGFVNDEPTSQAYQWMADLYLEGSAITSEEAEDVQQDSLALLIAGKQSTALVDSAKAVPMLEQAGIRWGAAMAPTEQKGNAKWTSTWTDGYGVTSTSQQSETAMQFMVFLAFRGSQLRLERGEVPLNMRLADQWAAASEGRRQVYNAIKRARPVPFIPGLTEEKNLIQQAWERMTIEGVPAKVALDDIAGPAQAVLDQYWAELDATPPEEEE